MGVFLFIELEREIPRFRDRFDGKPLAHARFEIDAIAQRLGLSQINDLMSMSVERAAELMEVEDPDFEVGDFQTEWFDPADGLKTFETLLDYFAKHPRELAKFKHPDDLREDLIEAARTLKAAQNAGVRFYLDCAY
jgi:hypothetical protein